MAFDGFVISNLKQELSDCLIDGRINKIYQPEKDEIHLLIKNKRQNFRLLLSASASLPLIYLTGKQKSNPMTAPNFCMLLRKYIQNGRILKIEQPGMERILMISIEHTDELGDLCIKKLVIELMGKHSNLIFIDNEGRIIDSIKHISAQISSVREVLPGRNYILPPAQDKISITELSGFEMFQNRISQFSLPLTKALYSSFQGISPVMARELLFNAGLAPDKTADSLSEEEMTALYKVTTDLASLVCDGRFSPCIYYREKEPVEFSSFPLKVCEQSEKETDRKDFDSISQVLEAYYAEKEALTRIRQKSSDLRRIITTALERTQKKYDLQLKQLKDTTKREKYKIYGEMLHTYGYSIEKGAKSLTCTNYYNNEEITIPLNPDLDPMENAKNFFARYNKLKRTYEALTELTVETKSQLLHLESILTALDIATLESDLIEIREELMEYGYLKRRGSKKGKNGRPAKSKPLHYISSDGFHMYVGKNNYQNDELSFKFANGKDMWFHAKGIAGSHVIVRLETADDLPDSTYEEAGRLAAFYSKGRNAPKVEIDYTRRKNLKKPPASKPGFVIYHTNYSMVSEPDISGIEEL
ncbi:MAG: NFACT RNA binding domain-containing protein [Lachnospiraceae bacterium]|nr:NFACT RNA binding domain-containing protein [Lachnospiraceae bacterium]